MDHDLKYTKENLKSYRKQQQQQQKRTLGSRTVQRILRLVTKSMNHKRKNNLIGFHPNLNFFLCKSPYEEMKTQATEKIFENHIYN